MYCFMTYKIYHYLAITLIRIGSEQVLCLNNYKVLQIDITKGFLITF